MKRPKCVCQYCLADATYRLKFTNMMKLQSPEGAIEYWWTCDEHMQNVIWMLLNGPKALAGEISVSKQMIKS